MVFSSITFLFYFLPLFLVAYFLLPFKNTVLLLASLLFYAWGELGYTLLLLISTAGNFIFGLQINANKGQQRAKLMLALGVILNLLLLSYFKYFNFLTGQVLGLDMSSEVHLPLGISFFTFQAISYLVDVYRGTAKVEKNPFDLGLYIAMFPQLIAGPIVRYQTVADAIKSRSHQWFDCHRGGQIFIIGLAQKVLIANQVALPADYVFALSANELSTTLAWLGAICYAIQIFFDFAGYSNMAIGLGMIIGFRFPINFNFPYIAQSITEFWRRWHISLSTWFRDYLYIPLGGNKVSSWRTYFNLLVVFLLCGFWHGAAWAFIIWGLYHGLFLIIERAFLGKLLSQCWRPLRHAYTLLVVLIGWVIFRIDDLSHLDLYLKAMFGFDQLTQITSLQVELSLVANSAWLALVVGILFSMPVGAWVNSLLPYDSTLTSKDRLTWAALGQEVGCLLLLLLAIVDVASGGYNPFIYFRF